MEKTIKILKIITLVLLAFLSFHYLNYNYPNNIISKIIRASSIVLTPVLIALVILYLVSPLTKRLVTKYKINKKVAIGITMLIFFTVFLALFGFVTYFIIDQGIILYNQITKPEFLDRVEEWFINNNVSFIYNAIINYIDNFDYQAIFGPIDSIILTIFHGLATIILAPIFLWHFLNFDDSIKNNIENNLPQKWHKTVIPIIYESNDIVSAYFRSKILSIIILFFMFVITYLFLGLPIGYVILFSFLIAALDLIPYVGPTAGLVIPIIYIFSVNGSNLFYNSNWHLNAIFINIILVLINVLIQFVQGNILIPLLSGKEMNINPALILVFMLFLGYILGIWGIVLAIPLGGIIIVVWNHVKTLDFFN